MYKWMSQKTLREGRSCFLYSAIKIFDIIQVLQDNLTISFMKTGEKSKNNRTQSATPNKKASTKSINPHKQANKSQSKSIERLNESPKRKKASTDHSKNIDFMYYVDLVTDELSHKKQKMQACIDLFNLMHSNNMQLRCMQHNNILTLYCLTQRRILCVNCTYGVTKHRTHKVIPLKDSGPYVSEDNLLLKDIIDNDLKFLEESLRNSQENSYILQRELKRTLQKFEEEYERKFEQMKERYEKNKQKIKKGFEQIITKTKSLEKGIEEFKFKIWQTLSKIGIGKRNQSSTNETQVIRQVFCVSLSELTRLEVRRMTKRQLDRLLSKLQE